MNASEKTYGALELRVAGRIGAELSGVALSEVPVSLDGRSVHCPS
jgi:hypothetical protein